MLTARVAGAMPAFARDVLVALQPEEVDGDVVSIGEHAEHHLLDMGLDRLGLDSDSAAAPMAGELATGVAGDAVLPNE